MDSVAKLMHISEDLIMLTMVGCLVILTADTIIQTADNVMMEDKSSMVTVVSDNDCGHVIRVLGRIGRVETERTTFQSPAVIIK